MSNNEHDPMSKPLQRTYPSEYDLLVYLRGGHRERIGGGFGRALESVGKRRDITVPQRRTSVGVATMQLAVKLAAIRDGGRRHHSCADVEQARPSSRI